MTNLHPAFYDLIPPIAQSIYRKYRQWTERDDILQELYAWALTRPDHFATLLNEENKLQRTINEKRLSWQMRRHAERYARKEKAKKSGYQIGDESFYDTMVLAQLLPHVISSVLDGTVLEQAQEMINDGQPRRGSAPAEGGNLLAILIDIKKAYLKLDVADKDILIHRYHHNLTLQELSEYLSCAVSTADRKVTSALYRLQNILGGASPWQ